MRQKIEQLADRPAADDARPRRVLVVSADMGAGYDATTAALEREIEERLPDSQVTRVDTLDVMGAAVGSVLRRIYVKNVEWTPWLHGFFYASLWRHRWFAKASKRFTGSWAGRRLAPIINRVDPDLIVSTDPLGSSGLAWLRRHRGLAVPVGAWISDFAPHPFWVYGEVDVTVVAHQVSAETALAAEPAAKVTVGTPPTLVAAAAQGLPRPDRPDGRFTILVACGSYSFGDVVDTITEVLGASAAVRVVAACGRNAALQRRVQRLNQPTDRLVALGWTNEMAKLLTEADLLITNGGGATALEAFSVGTPVLMYRPIAAHGAANADLMVVAGVAELVADRRQLANYIRAATAGLARPRLGTPAQPSPGPDGLRRLANLPSSNGPMAPNDAFFAYLDSRDVRQELGVVVELGRRPDGTVLRLSEMRAEIIRGFRDLPAMRRGLVRTTRPGWRLYLEASLDGQVRNLAPPASTTGQTSQQRLLSAIAAFWSEPLPDDGPAWCAGLIQDPQTGRSLVAIKLHHSVADGLAALPILDRLFGGNAAASFASRARAIDKPRNAIDGQPLATRLRSWARMVSGVASLAAHAPAGRQPLTDGPVSQRRVLVTWDAPRGDFLSAARRLRVRPHDLALGLMAEALSRLLVPAGLVDTDVPLRVMVPTTVRGRGDRLLGNKTGAIGVDLPLEPMTLRSRLDKITDATRRSARRREPQAAYAVMRLAGRLPPRLHAAVARRIYHRRFFHAILTYLPGPRQPRWLADAPVRAVYPILPLAPTVPLTAGLLTFGAAACVGVQLDASLNLGPGQVRQALDGAWSAVARGEGPTSTTYSDPKQEDPR
jgi:UDP-N-acetylglucosamine:LPS N-acetylglucosamine transferase